MKLIVGFSTTSSWYSRLIRWFTESEVSHTYVRVYDEFIGEWLIIHADMPGVIIETQQVFKAKNLVIEEFEIEDTNLRKSLRTNLRHLGKKYDWFNILGWVWVITFKRWFKRKIENPLSNPKRLVCVDFVSRVLNDAGVTTLPLGKLHPKGLRKVFNNVYNTMGWKKLEH